MYVFFTHIVLLSIILPTIDPFFSFHISHALPRHHASFFSHISFFLPFPPFVSPSFTLSHSLFPISPPYIHFLLLSRPSFLAELSHSQLQHTHTHTHTHSLHTSSAYRNELLKVIAEADRISSKQKEKVGDALIPPVTEK